MTRFDLATPLVGGTLGGKLKSGGKLTTAARSYLTHSAKLASLPPPFRHARQTGTLSQLASLPHPRRVSSGKLSAQHSGSLAGTMKYQDHPGAFDASRGGLAPTVPAGSTLRVAAWRLQSQRKDKRRRLASIQDR
ncbi:MAG: hypothetical protein ABSB35_24630 [Bryobacteraceae bacterium]